MVDDFDEPLFDERPEFDYRVHQQVDSVHIGANLLEVYAVGDGYHWELVDSAGRTHHYGDDCTSIEQALSAGAAAAGEPLPERIDELDDELGEI